jgi:hypothetical protein
MRSDYVPLLWRRILPSINVPLCGIRLLGVSRLRLGSALGRTSEAARGYPRLSADRAERRRPLPRIILNRWI